MFRAILNLVGILIHGLHHQLIEGNFHRLLVAALLVNLDYIINIASTEAFLGNSLGYSFPNLRQSRAITFINRLCQLKHIVVLLRFMDINFLTSHLRLFIINFPQTRSCLKERGN